jgi:hypothetical protein
VNIVMFVTKAAAVAGYRATARNRMTAAQSPLGLSRCLEQRESPIEYGIHGIHDIRGFSDIHDS